MGEQMDIEKDLAQLVRLGLSEQPEDVRLFVARLVRKYRKTKPELAEQIDLYLRSKKTRKGGVIRRLNEDVFQQKQFPIDNESNMSLLKIVENNPPVGDPILSKEVASSLNQLIKERKHGDRLKSLGLQPTRSAIFLGRPGVGKTLTSRWIASQLNVPLYILDLTTVMSSLLGKTGMNIRSALDFSKNNSCVLLLDEFDSIAKKRSDESDIGELKRLVTVILQEVDEWPSTSLLLAATNYPELIDPALWRRFDMVVEFKSPDESEIKEAIKRFLGPDISLFSDWIDILAFTYKGQTYNDIEKSIQRIRRGLALGDSFESEVVGEFIKSRVVSLDRQQRISLAIQLGKQGMLSRHMISEITGVSRDTIRKYAGTAAIKGKKGNE